MANQLKTEKKIAAVSMLCEGNSIRSIERMTDVHRDTVMRLGVRMGKGCQEIMDKKMVDLPSKRIEVDEIWGFVGAKQKTKKAKKLGAEFGDVWTWVALDADTKLVPTYAVGDRSAWMARSFMEDLAGRMRNRIQLSSDALRAYMNAVERAFGSEIDYGQVIKTFSHTDLAESRRYSPPECLKIKKVVVQGNPDMRKASTSYIEKQNHTMRMHCRRLSRLTNAFSKKRENFEAAIALHFVYYNFIKRHITIKCTPAMEAGVEDSFWSVADLVEMIEG